MNTNTINEVLNEVLEKSRQMPDTADSRGRFIKALGARTIVATARTAKAVTLVARIMANKKARRLAIGAIKARLSHYVEEQEAYLRSIDRKS